MYEQSGKILPACVVNESSTIRKAGAGVGGAAAVFAYAAEVELVAAREGRIEVLARGWVNSAGKEPEEEVDEVLEEADGPATNVSMLVLRVLSSAMLLEFNEFEEPDEAIDLLDTEED
jgi:hypothetical protein